MDTFTYLTDLVPGQIAYFYRPHNCTKENWIDFDFVKDNPHIYMTLMQYESPENQFKALRDDFGVIVEPPRAWGLPKTGRHIKFRYIPSFLMSFNSVLRMIICGKFCKEHFSEKPQASCISQPAFKLLDPNLWVTGGECVVGTTTLVVNSKQALVLTTEGDCEVLLIDQHSLQMSLTPENYDIWRVQFSIRTLGNSAKNIYLYRDSVGQLILSSVSSSRKEFGAKMAEVSAFWNAEPGDLTLSGPIYKRS